METSKIINSIMATSELGNLLDALQLLLADAERDALCPLLLAKLAAKMDALSEINDTEILLKEVQNPLCLLFSYLDGSNTVKQMLDDITEFIENCLPILEEMNRIDNPTSVEPIASSSVRSQHHTVYFYSVKRNSILRKWLSEKRQKIYRKLVCWKSDISVSSNKLPKSIWNLVLT